MGAAALALGLVAAWVLWTTTPPEAAGAHGDSSPAPAGAVDTATPAKDSPTPLPRALKLEERLYSDYGFRVSLDPSWDIQTGGAGLRIDTPEGRFHVLRTPAPTRIGKTAEPPADQVVAASKRVAGTDILCTVDPDAGEAVRATASKICPTVTEQGGLGVITLFECRGDKDIDLDATIASISGLRPQVIECFTAGHRADPGMTTGKASVAVEPSPDGVPLTILVGGDVPTERSFLWMRGCFTHVFRQATYIKTDEGRGMVSCELAWSLE
jgi:hypothetical protein